MKHRIKEQGYFKINSHLPCTSSNSIIFLQFYSTYGSQVTYEISGGVEEKEGETGYLIEGIPHLNGNNQISICMTGSPSG